MLAIRFWLLFARLVLQAYCHSYAIRAIKAIDPWLIRPVLNRLPHELAADLAMFALKLVPNDPLEMMAPYEEFQ